MRKQTSSQPTVPPIRDMSVTIVGIDPSVAKTGIAVLNEDGSCRTGFIVPPAKMQDPGRLQWIASTVLSFVKRSAFFPPWLLVIETPSQSRGTPINFALHWRIREELANAVPVHTLAVQPVHLKQFACDDARAEKGTVAFSVTRKWGDALPDATEEDTLEAFGLAKLGECWYCRGESRGPWNEYEKRIALTRSMTGGERISVFDTGTFAGGEPDTR